MPDYDPDTGEILAEVIPPEEAGLIIRQHETAAMDVQVATAQKLGRSIKHFQADLESWACATQEIADECTYLLEKGGTKIVGPSIRFAELLMASYRHIVADTFIEAEEHGHVVVGAMVRDLFRNIAVRARVRRNILKKDGKTRYKQDVIQSTVQAAASLALRNAVIRLVPKALWQPIWLKSRAVAQGMDPETGKPVIPFKEQAQRAISFMGSLGATEEQVLKFCGVDSREALTPDHLIHLRNTARAVRAGEVDIDAALHVEEEKLHGKETADAAGEKVKKAAAAKKKATPKKKAKGRAKKKPEDPPPAEGAGGSNSPEGESQSSAPAEEAPPEEPTDAGVPAVDL